MNSETNNSSRSYYVTGLTHIDLAWLHDSHHYFECQKNAVVRLLDCLESDPDFTYIIEQITHFKRLAVKRPDLIHRLREFVQGGRVEIGGAMASSLDTNGPNGEAYVRNHLLGRRWVRENFQVVDVVVGDLIDTFGISAQTPQIHKQLGMPYLLANRLGGKIPDDVFYCRGLDGTTILVAGPDVHSPVRRTNNVHFRLVQGSVHILDDLFTAAAAGTRGGPQLVLVYDENERVPLIRSRDQIDKQNRERKKWRYTSLQDFFHALEDDKYQWPTISGDLNPAFTGCFGLRPYVRQLNRKLETNLIEAEKWATLAGANSVKVLLDEAWWTMSIIQSHDVYSGSFPHNRVEPEVITWIDEVQEMAERLLAEVIGPTAPKVLTGSAISQFTAFNGLPFSRHEVVTIPVDTSTGIASITANGTDLPFEQTAQGMRIQLELPATGSIEIEATSGPAFTHKERKLTSQAVIENSFLRVEVSARKGIEHIIQIPDGNIICSDCGGLLVVQQDDGTYQIDQPVGSEVEAGYGSMELYEPIRSQIGQELVLSGTFPHLPWAGPDAELSWEVTLFLASNSPHLDINFKINWKGERSRIRIALPTTIQNSLASYEIPFGIVSRMPYGTRQSCNGEWPTHRFVAVEDKNHGIALINAGTIGAEFTGGRIIQTLLRAPFKAVSLMEPDETSSSNGEHHFQFSIVPYQGPLADSPVIRCAQEFNTPVLVRKSADIKIKKNSLMSLEPPYCVLSTIKFPEDGETYEMIVRFYETAGRNGTATLVVDGMEAAWTSDLLEKRGATIQCTNGRLEIPVTPFEIVTLRIMRR